MSIRLSQTEITSFCGDVLPLHLNFDASYHTNLKNAEIEWSTDSDAVSLRSFAGEDETSFSNGVLLLLQRVGSATVTAKLGRHVYTCHVTVREMRHATSDEPLQYYLGDLHDHTTYEHNHENFAARQRDFHCEYIDFIKEEAPQTRGLRANYSV